nr:histidine--tRNA ligase [Actinomycetota bacterium]
AEALGTQDPALDAELIWLAVAGYAALGLTGVRLLLNSLGDAQCRPAYRETLQAYLASLELDDETQRRAQLNPLRVLDDKRPEVRGQLADAPLMADHLCDDCRAYHGELMAVLDALGITYEPTPSLVRGLDYYTRTTFEFVHDGLGAQSAVGGGGRYDGLAEEIGGPALPGIGWALGVDRVSLALAAEGRPVQAPAACEVFLVALGERAKRRVVGLAAQLRTAGVPTDLAYGDRGMKGAMKAADRSGARLAIVVGDRDLEQGLVQVKELRDGTQTPVAFDDVISTVRGKL